MTREYGACTRQSQSAVDEPAKIYLTCEWLEEVRRNADFCLGTGGAMFIADSVRQSGFS